MSKGSDTNDVTDRMGFGRYLFKLRFRKAKKWQSRRDVSIVGLALLL